MSRGVFMMWLCYNKNGLFYQKAQRFACISHVYKPLFLMPKLSLLAKLQSRQKRRII
ncbi:hypothetical protein [Moraxella lacunata]|uniref:hypothetical protein n=1 Tax=Moraxella lacunata TaxID=477 RepID=UPI003EE342F9